MNSLCKICGHEYKPCEDREYDSAAHAWVDKDGGVCDDCVCDLKDPYDEEDLAD